MKLKNLDTKSILKFLKPISLMLLLPLFGLLYAALNQNNGAVYSLVTDLDKIIPFSKYFVLPYVLWYPFIFFMMVYFCIKDKKVYYDVLIAMVAGLSVNLITYAVFQTTVARPEIIHQDVFSNMVRFVYNMDQPYNCFPSGHVLTSYAVMYGTYLIKDINKGLLYLSQGMGILIILSTQFMKQHTLLDAVASIVIVNVIMSILNAWKGWAYTGEHLSPNIGLKEKYSYNKSMKRV